MVDREEAKTRLAMAAAWQTAAFHRARRMPPFSRAVNPEGKVRSREDLISKLKIRFGSAGGDKDG